MSGTLDAESELGKGSSFIFKVPLEVLNDQPEVIFAVKPVLNHVLIIDDNITNCALMKGVFEHFEISSTICFGGQEALDLMETAKSGGQAYDLIITDHQMPGMDGITMVKKIKARLNGDTAPFILMLSSLDQSLYQHEAETIGINKLEMVNSGDEIMVVENEPMNMLLISAILRTMGINVIESVSGNHALQMLSVYSPAMIFMDINMPEMDGLDVTRMIRKLKGPNSDIPIIALTADAMKEDRQRCLDAGMNDYVSKPFRLDDISLVLNKYYHKDK